MLGILLLALQLLASQNGLNTIQVELELVVEMVCLCSEFIIYNKP
jgi:hypothetical protein